MINKEINAALGGKALKLTGLSFHTDSKIAETQTLGGGIIRRVTGCRKNFFTLKGKMSFFSFLSFCDYINELAASSLTLEIDGDEAAELILTKGECTLSGDGMCDYTLELEEAEI